MTSNSRGSRKSLRQVIRTGNAGSGGKGIDVLVHGAVDELLEDLDAVVLALCLQGHSTDGLAEKAVCDGQHVRLVDDVQLLDGRESAYEGRICRVARGANNGRVQMWGRGPKGSTSAGR